MKVLIAERFSANAYSFLKGHRQFEVIRNPVQQDWGLADAAIIRSKTKIDSILLNHAPNLKLIVTATSGYDHIDLNETHNRKIKVFYTPEANAASAAELTWGLLLSCSKKIPFANESLKKHIWDRDQLNGIELEKKILGIVGLGRVGLRVAKIAQGFGMKVVAFDPYQKNEIFVNQKVSRMGFTEVIRICDVLSLHVPYTEETHQMVNARSLEEVQPHCILINTSRGQVLAEQDLVLLLGNKKLAAAGLDVFAKEPLPKDSPLIKLNNVVITPHIGASTEEAFQRASAQAAQIVIDVFNGQSPENELFPKSSFAFK